MAGCSTMRATTHCIVEKRRRPAMAAFNLRIAQADARYRHVGDS